MLKILIVDDEAIERTGLKLILNKAFDGQVFIEEADTGQKAIEKAYAYMPDVVFMDMKMPGLDGIEAIIEIQKFASSAKIIIVSAYDSFEYAQKAVAVGAFKYLLKPVKRKDILSCVNELIEIRKDELKRVQLNAELKAKLSEVRPYMEGELIQALIYNDEGKTSMFDNMDLIDVNMSEGNCIVVDHANGQLSNHDLNRLEEKIRSKISSRYDALIGRSYGGNILALISKGSLEANADLKQDTLAFARKLKYDIVHEYGIQIEIGVGMPYKGLNCVHQSYKDAVLNLKGKVKGSITQLSQSREMDSAMSSYPIELENSLCQQIKLGLLNESREAYVEFMESIFNGTENQDYNEKLKEAWTVLSRLFSSIIDSKDMNELPGVPDSIFRKSNFSQAMDCIWHNIDFVVKKVNAKRVSQSENLVDQAKTFIDQNYHKHLTLESVADELAVSPYYLSKLFKQQANKNFIDYLTHIRIENAKILIRSSSLSIKEISRKVGYSNPNYFSRVFKKVTAIKPLEYRDK